MYPLDDTIVAIASPPGGAARGMVRLSGPNATGSLKESFRADGCREWFAVDHPCTVSGSLRLAELASAVPCELYLWPPGKSYTGQPVVEIHTLGSRPLLDAVLHALCAAGARGAEPGEFTLRAFLCGRIDLTEAEAVLGVIDAVDDRQLEVALAQLAGGLAAPLHELRDELVDLLAHLEAGFDFADEDLPFVTAEKLQQDLSRSGQQIQRLAVQMASRGATADLIRVVLIGQPNTGKSSLFNALAQAAGALVSEQPGTTRDYLTAELDLGGVRCQLIDTAGVQLESVPSRHGVDASAQAVTADQSRQADLQILCLDATRPINDWEQEKLADPSPERRIVVWTKIDAAGEQHVVESALHTSSFTGQGTDTLRAVLRDAVLAAWTSGTRVVAGTAVRCRESLRRAGESLQRARQIVRTAAGEELVAAEIRVALAELGKVVGVIYTDDVLDRVFSRFCIGK